VELKIAAISDTHNETPKMPKGADVLIHAGDLTMMGREFEVRKSIDWLKSLKKRYKKGIILVPGNHDFLFEDWREGLPKTKRGMELERNFALAKQLCDDAGIILLMDQSVEIEGVKIYGSPYSLRFHDWAFNLSPMDSALFWAKNIPKDTNVLVTHGPPFGIGDLCRGGHVGDSALLELIKSLPDLKMHIYGHIHEGSGVHWFNNKLFINASALNEYYQGFNDIHVVSYPSLNIRRFPDESV